MRAAHDEKCAARKDESWYQLCLGHTFHPSLVLTLRSPSSLRFSVVGYHKKPEGTFMIRLNACDAVGSSEGKAKGMSIPGFGTPLEGSQHIDNRAPVQKGLGLM